MDSRKSNHRHRNERRDTDGAYRRTHVLLAEDDAEMRSLMAFTLRRNGFAITTVHDGLDLQEFLDDLAAGRDTGRIDLIVSDIRMPGTTGLDVLERAEAIENAPPFILITAFGDERTHERARMAGAISIIDKPFDMSVLLKEVHRVLSRGDQSCHLSNATGPDPARLDGDS